MAQQTTSYEGNGNNEELLMLAEMGLWMGSGWASGIEKRLFTKLGAWKGSSRATSRALNAVRSSGALGPTMAKSSYGRALNLMQRPGRGWLANKGWKVAKKAGIRKQFAILAASRLGAVIHTGLNVAMWAPLAFQGTMGVVTSLRSIGRKGPRQEFGERFFDNQDTYTERQRAIRAITSSRLSTRSAIGNEAQLIHR